MRIYSMTATFGKLDHQTITLAPGLNVIQAPNEWGKSTWCAFLAAMLYGLDTRTHTTKTALSDKERYAPWSGAPMSGRIDLHWNGRDITIERKSKGRTVFGDFRAYETASGLPVPELTAQNCGQMLLGVEKTVFTRSAMIRLTDLPVTLDEALRRRLNALVTTGDESGAGEDLEQRLRDLKNRCRYNRTGLLPQAEAELAALEGTLRELEALEAQSRKLRQRRAALESETAALENHRTALSYRAAQENAQRLHAAREALLRAGQALQEREAQCAALPNRDRAQRSLDQLQVLQDRWTQLRMAEDASEAPAAHPIFGSKTAEEAETMVSGDIAEYKKLRKWHPLALFFALVLIAGGAALCISAVDHRPWGLAALACGALTAAVWSILTVLRRVKTNRIASRYGAHDTALWASLKEDYVNQLTNAQCSAQARQATVQALRAQTLQLCQGRSLSDAQAYWREVCAKWDRLEAARREYRSRGDSRDALQSLPTAAPAPEEPDDLTLSDAQTRQAIADRALELNQLQRGLGQCQGQMEALGHRTVLESRRNALTQRIRQLEDTYAALTLAISTLESARASLQRRFAPRITGRAQEILNRLTDGRYDRLVLGADLTLHATARDENTLRSALWRSDGTADLLYLALRLAVAGALTPEAPLILDDALVRFDDARLARAMTVLKEEASHRQILLFTCHAREAQYV